MVVTGVGLVSCLGHEYEPVLDALRIPFDRLRDPATVKHQVAEARTLAESATRPVALLLTRDLMWES